MERAPTTGRAGWNTHRGHHRGERADLLQYPTTGRASCNLRAVLLPASMTCLSVPYHGSCQLQRVADGPNVAATAPFSTLPRVVPVATGEQGRLHRGALVTFSTLPRVVPVATRSTPAQQPLESTTFSTLPRVVPVAGLSVYYAVREK